MEKYLMQMSLSGEQTNPVMLLGVKTVLKCGRGGTQGDGMITDALQVVIIFAKKSQVFGFNIHKLVYLVLFIPQHLRSLRA